MGAERNMLWIRQIALRESRYLEILTWGTVGKNPEPTEKLEDLRRGIPDRLDSLKTIRMGLKMKRVVESFKLKIFLSYVNKALS
jgi:hypothetical protein